MDRFTLVDLALDLLVAIFEALTNFSTALCDSTQTYLKTPPSEGQVLNLTQAELILTV